MFVGITNTPRDYAWGSQGAISDLLGWEATSGVEAELWLGAHPASPSRLVGDSRTLPEILDARLPFLLKVLAARSALSLQAHPNASQAAEGFARENAAGIALDAPHRNYRDGNHKPELIYALEDGFEALCGFRSVAEVRDVIARLHELDDAHGGVGKRILGEWSARLGADGTLRGAFEWLIGRGEGVDGLVSRLSELAGTNAPELDTVRILAAGYPGDPGIVISLMLNRVTLRRGEVLYLPAGNIHSYLSGMGIELMAASDNVLRGGLTPKRVDVQELLAVLDFRPLRVPYLQAENPAPGVEIYRPDVADFLLVHVTASAEFAIDGPAILLCTEGSFTVSGAIGGIELARGESVYVSPDESVLRFRGEGSVFVATTG